MTMWCSFIISFCFSCIGTNNIKMSIMDYLPWHFTSHKMRFKVLLYIAQYSTRIVMEVNENYHSVVCAEPKHEWGSVLQWNVVYEPAKCTWHTFDWAILLWFSQTAHGLSHGWWSNLWQSTSYCYVRQKVALACPHICFVL